MTISTVLAPLYDPARLPPQLLRPRPSAQRVTFARAPASPLVARMPRHHANLVIKQIGVFGRESQVPAMELRNYLAGENIDTKVKIGWGDGSRSSAREIGFTEEDGTLGDILETIRGSDLVWYPLLPDIAALEAHDYARIFSLMKPHSILVVSDGVVGPGHMQTLATDNQRNIIAIHVHPEEMGPFVRDLNIRARQVNGAGIDSSLPVHQEDTLTFRWRSLGLHMMLVAESLMTLMKYQEDRPFRWRDLEQHMLDAVESLVMLVAESLVTLMKYQEGRPFRQRDLGPHLTVAFIAVSFLALMKYQGGAVAYSFSLILFWGAALYVFTQPRSLPRSWFIALLSLISVAVIAMNMSSSSKVQPTGASGCPTLPCDGAQSCCSCDQAFPNSGVSQNGTVVIQNIWNILSFRGFFLGNAGDRVIFGH